MNTLTKTYFFKIRSAISDSKTSLPHKLSKNQQHCIMYHEWYTKPIGQQGVTMPPNPLKAAFFKTAKGNEPVKEWLLELRKHDRAIIGGDIRTVQIGWPLGMPLVRKMEPDLWEVRSIIADGIARVLFTLEGESMVLLHGFVKKSQKTPQGDLALAIQRLKELRGKK
jgi:phage-related protein